MPVLYLSPSEAPQNQLLQTILEAVPDHTPVLGFFGSEEQATVDLGSLTGHWNAVMTNTNAPLSAGNLSALASDLPTDPYLPMIDETKILQTLSGLPVATLYSSDGDALQFQMDRGFQNIWDWEQVKGFNFGWTINPTLLDFSPLVWNYYN